MSGADESYKRAEEYYIFMNEISEEREGIYRSIAGACEKGLKMGLEPIRILDIVYGICFDALYRWFREKGYKSEFDKYFGQGEGDE